MRIKLIIFLSLIWFEFVNGRISGEAPTMAEANTNFEDKNDEMMGDNVMKTDSEVELEASKNSDEPVYTKNDKKDGEENNEANENGAQNIGIQKDNDEKMIADQEWKNAGTENVENLKERDKLLGKNEEIANQNQMKELELENTKYYDANFPSEAVKNLSENASITENSDDLKGYLRIFPFLKPCSPDSIKNFRELLRDSKLTKGELEDRREKWAEKQSEDVKKAFMEWKTRLNEGKQKVAKRMAKNLASYIEGIQNVYQKLKEIISNMQISRKEECQQIRSLVNSAANSDVREYFVQKVRIRLVQYCLAQKGNDSVNEVSIESANANPIKMKNQQTDHISQISKAQDNEQRQPETQKSSNEPPTSTTSVSNQGEFVNNGEKINVKPNLPMEDLPKKQQEPSDKNILDKNASNGSSVSSEEEDGDVVDERKTAVNGTAPIWPNSVGMNTTTWKPDPVPDPPKNVNNSSSSSSSEENLENEVKKELEKEDKLDKVKTEAEKEDVIKDEKKKEINERNKNAGDMEESGSSSSSSSSESGSSSSSSNPSSEDDKDNLAKGNGKRKKGVKKGGKEDNATEEEESCSSSSSSSEENEQKDVKGKKNKKREGKKKKYGTKRKEMNSSASSSLEEEEGNKTKKDKLKDEEEYAANEEDDNGKKHGKRKHNRHGHRGKKESSEVEDKKKKHKNHQKEE